MRNKQAPAKSRGFVFWEQLNGLFQKVSKILVKNFIVNQLFIRVR